MKNNLNLFFFLLLFTLAANLASGQNAVVKMQFGVLGENGNFFTELKASDIQILQGKKYLQPSSLELKTDIPVEIVIMIDASVSQERTLPNEQKIAEYFIDNILKNGKDKIAIAKFAGGVSFEQDLTADFTKAKKRLGKIEFEKPAGYAGGGVVVGNTPNKPVTAPGSTSIWDSIKLISEDFAKIKTTNSRRAIILISDGVNTFGESKLNEAIEASIKTQIPVYAVGIGEEYYGGIDRKTLKKLTEQTSGVLIIPKKKLGDLPQEMKRIEQSLRSFYEVTFSPDSAGSKDLFQELKIDIIKPDLRRQKLQTLQPKGFFLSN
ncbi:MAG: VWA domain-containing protein [Pyrinomonadaceae bacterium]